MTELGHAEPVRLCGTAGCGLETLGIMAQCDIAARRTLCDVF
jgi:hypothetical protein